MKAIIRAARGGLGGRRLQAVIIGLVALASTAASTLALAMLADSSSPFDRAFAAQHGANVTATLATSATPAQLAATAHAAGVTAAAGPFPEISFTAQLTLPGAVGANATQFTIVGRSSPGGPVDDLSLDAGHWPDSDSQAVLAGGALGSTLTVGSQKLTVVGLASSVTSTAGGWVLPSEIPALANAAGGGRSAAGTGDSAQAQMLYQFSDAGTSTAVSADVATLRAALPPGALLNSASWLDARQSEQSSIAPWVPFIVAFGLLAVVISVLIVVNVVSGAVIAGTTRIGVLKSLGFTPAQVVASYVLMVALPGIFGSLAGAVCGNLLAVPLLGQQAQAYQVGVLGVPFWVDVTVPLAVLALTAAGAVAPALRAGRMSAVTAIAAGRAPRPAHGYLAQRALARLTRLPRAVTLGLAAPSARPGRTLVTMLAVVFGGVTVTFGVGLAISLDRAYAAISQHATPVTVTAEPPGAALPRNGTVFQVNPGEYVPRPGVGQPMTSAQQRALARALAAQPGTLRDFPVTVEHLDLPGVAAGVTATAYGGDPAWAGLTLVSGHLYSGPGQVDVNTLFLTDTGTRVGSTYILESGSRRLTVTIAGEVFKPGNQPNLYLSAATLRAADPAAAPSQYDVSLKPGTNAQDYADTVSVALGKSFAVDVNAGSSALIAVVSLVTMLTILIAVVAGFGVLNTVILQVRERAHAIGVLKAVGMIPRQTLVMIVCSVAATGLLAGVAAVPAGVYLHHGLVPVMTRAANSAAPPSMLSVYQPWELILLALAGLAIAVAGALGPATWAARTRTAFTLRAE